MAYTGIDVNSLLPGEPVTSAIMLALRGDPLSIAAGEIGAPKVVSAALGMNVAAGEQSITVSSESVLFTMLNLDRVATVALATFLQTTDTSTLATARYRTSTDGGLNWSGYTNTAAVAPSVSQNATKFSLIDVSGAINAMEVSVTSGPLGSGTVTGNALGLAVVGITD